jgi:ankyrin repeat protein
MTPLHLASQEGQVEVARMLIERGADVTAKTRMGRVHYIWRCFWGKRKSLACLLSAARM